MKALIFIVLLSTSFISQAKMLWSDASISLLYGQNYQVGHKYRNVITLEHAAGHSWGDHFFFVDRIDRALDKATVYAEFMPRVSGNAFFDDAFKFGVIKDVLLATRFEYAEATGERNYLLGFGVDLDLPGFTYFKINTLHRENEFYPDNTLLMMVWAVPFNLFGQNWLYDGFYDWNSGTQGYASSFNMTSQLKIQVNQSKKYPIYLGVEYAYWNNKFGIKDTPEFNTDERNVSALLKFHF
ncbi:outer membrane protein OmpK [Catenovulum sp. SX2]|uniref:outer membrane protein OmpK n=1 Tax=Catenovulum sp. SX2 TaxID=3398614 RepID=UPI003F83F16E